MHRAGRLQLAFLPLILSLAFASPALAATWYQDADNDGYGNPSVSVSSPTQPAGYVANNLDCNDSNFSIHPGAVELCNGQDDDCDGLIDEGTGGTTWYRDADSDTYGNAAVTTVACTQPAGYVANNLDCDDTRSTVHPGATEICDGLDNDCDGLIDEGASGATWYADSDGDGFGDASIAVNACVAPSGYVADGTDCDDSRATVHPGAPELCDGLDNDCDGATDEGCTGLVLTSVKDVGNDQGRRARAIWHRHSLDVAGSATPITSYSLYRRVDTGLLAGRTPGASELLAAPPGQWDFVVNVPATGEESYSVVAATLCDSTSEGICWSVFFVRAHTATPTTLFDSPADSGYSIDNLAPNVPAELAVTYSPGSNQLTWAESDDADFRYFRVYRGSSADFVPTAANRVQETTANGWIDASGTGSGAFYKVTAVDFSGNESAPALASPTVGVESSRGAAAFALERPRPNPSLHDVDIAFGVRGSGGAVRLQVFDAAGRLVRTLVDRELPPGRHVARWNGRDESESPAPAGVYLVRLQSAGRTLQTKLMRTR